jgi:putative aminopeptidase FrvX
LRKKEKLKLNQLAYLDYILDQTQKILSIDSPTGFTKNVTEYVMEEYRSLGYSPKQTIKGGIICEISGDENSNDAICLEAHVDTLGGMVSQITETGRLILTPLGGLEPNNTESENCKIYTRSGKIYSGTMQMKNASVHVNKNYRSTVREFDTMEVVIDEKVNSKEDVLSLHIRVGDIVCFDPRTVLTESGYLKSRFLDDKVSVGILLGFAKYVKEENIKLPRKIYQYITVFEEVGHGGSGSIPTDVTEVISVDLGCVGDGLTCTEYQVSICAKDSVGPYHYDVVSGLIKAAENGKIDYAVDIYPHYASDVDSALTAGYEVRHGLIGPGVYATHGYERSHKDGILNTFLLLTKYLA